MMPTYGSNDFLLVMPTYDNGDFLLVIPTYDNGDFLLVTPTYDNGDFLLVMPTYGNGDFLLVMPTYDNGDFLFVMPTYGTGDWQQSLQAMFMHTWYQYCTYRISKSIQVCMSYVKPDHLYPGELDISSASGRSLCQFNKMLTTVYTHLVRLKRVCHKILYLYFFVTHLGP